MMQIEDFIDDFDAQTKRILLLRMDDRCYTVELLYIPFLEKTDYVTNLDNLQTTINFILFSTEEDDGIITSLVTIFKAVEEKYKIQTLFIKVTRMFPVDMTQFEDIFPPKLESRESQPNRIRRLAISLNTFDKF